MVLQGVSIALIWTFQRRLLAPLHGVFDWLLAVLTAVLAAGSVWIMIAAERTLGKQFAYQARLVEGHRLIVSGPYRFVRHPIYAALFGLALATALVRSRWFAIPAFVPLYAAGTAMRIRSEERLLREAFGEEFEAYRRRVAAVIPGLL